MATSKIEKVYASEELLSNGLYLIRHGNSRTLSFRLYPITGSTGINVVTLAEGDRPIHDLSATGLRRNTNNTGTCIAFFTVGTNGQVDVLYTNVYNGSSALTNVSKSDQIDGQITWTVA